MAPFPHWFIACAFLLGTSPVRSYVMDSDVSVQVPGSYLANASSVFFNLYTRNNPFEPEILRLGDLESLQQSNYKSFLPTKMVAHGYNGDPGTFNSTKNAFLRRENCNFITIDWTELASGFDYPLIVVRNIPLAASEIGAFVEFLCENTGASLKSFHLIGFSLGAHVAGGAGAAIGSGKVFRITGLDPAAPGFSVNDTETRLDPTDGDFVDIVHTNSGSLIQGGESMIEPIGHADFYPNGGQQQPGCLFTKSEEEVDFQEAETRDCNHSRAVMYFDESINSMIGFQALQCDSLEEYQMGFCDSNPAALMGEPTPVTTRGIFYLITNDVEPFAMG
ncbi:pancreatic lipase-related protein 2-like [Daphnia pulicaria]|uniref:pancreatic lipase-related protein 2-like n=1 Tax=Daphnia pulicaria TaxID=35523 RepID=UPI001EE9B151|nr:pancreatic lipase-related protein 2-like [Daphnia pulicaria]